MPANSESNQAKPEVKVTKTNETAKILNYACTKYIVETSQGGKPVTHLIWATAEVKDIDLKALARQGANNRGSFFHEGVDAFPMKAEMSSAEGKVIIEAREIKRESLPASLFELPGSYKEAAPTIPGFRN